MNAPTTTQTTDRHSEAGTWDAHPRAWVALLLLALFVWVAFLGTRDLWYPDEPDIGEVCKAMYDSGDWVAPRRNGVIWVDYPPMIYWAGTASAHLLGGMSAFALRLPNALAGIGVMLLTFFAGRRWFGARAGFWAGFTMLTFLAVTYETVSYRPDTFFTLFIAGGMFLYARAMGQKRPGWGLRVAAFALLGLAMLSKGPLGLLLPGLVLTLWHVSRREWRRFLELAPLAVVSSAIYMAWFVACANAMGADSILYELYAQNFARFASGFRGHEQPLHYYFVKIWPNLAPWSPLLPFAIYWLVRSGRWRDRNVQLCLWWLGAFFVFLSMAVTKRALYMLPAFPAAALMLAPYLAAVGRPAERGSSAPDPRPVRVYAAALGVIFVLLGLLACLPAVSFDSVASRLDRLDELELQVARAARIPLAGVGLAFLAFGLSFLQAWRRADVRAALVRFGASFLVLYVLAFAWLLPTFSPTKSYRPQCEWIRAQIGDSPEIGLVNPKWAHRKMGAFGFYTGALVRKMETREEIAAFFVDRPESVVLVERALAEQLFADEEPQWRERVLRDLQTGSHHYKVVRAP